MSSQKPRQNLQLKLLILIKQGKKIQMWQIVTSVEKNQQAIIIFLKSLEGNPKAEKAVSACN